MTDPSSRILPPIQAGPARRTFHTILAIAGWALFVYWWWIVFQRVSSHEVRFTAFFIAVSLALIVITTLAWAWHNVRIWKRKGARKHVREATSEFQRDGIGRLVAFSAIGPDRHTAPVVYVRFASGGKRYDVAAGMPPRYPGSNPPPPPPTPPPPAGTGRRTPTKH